jgi:hypothetical protein
MHTLGFLGSKSTLDYVGRGFDHGYFCTYIDCPTAYDAIHTYRLVARRCYQEQGIALSP